MRLRNISPTDLTEVYSHKHIKRTYLSDRCQSEKPQPSAFCSIKNVKRSMRQSALDIFSYLRKLKSELISNGQAVQTNNFRLRQNTI